MSKIRLKQALTARRLSINPGIQCIKMCWLSCGNDLRTLRTVKGSWCVGLARSRLPIRFIDAVTHIPPPLGDGTGQAPPGPNTRPTRACTQTLPRSQPTEHNTEAYIRTCVENILARRLHVGGLTCHFAPAAQPERVPYGHGGIIGVPFE